VLSHDHAQASVDDAYVERIAATYPAGRGLPVQRRRQPPLGLSVSPYSSL